MFPLKYKNGSKPQFKSVVAFPGIQVHRPSRLDGGETHIYMVYKLC